MGFLLVISIILIILSTMMQKNLFGEHLSYQEFMVAVENKTISEIQIEQNQQDIQQAQRAMQRLDNLDSLERFAREEYYMHADNEDVYLVD